MYYIEELAMTLTVRLPDRVEQELAEYCVTRGVTKSDAVKAALEQLLRAPAEDMAGRDHPFVGSDNSKGDVARHTKRLLRERLLRRA